MENVDIIIVNWNTGALLQKCLSSLKALPENEKKLIGKIIVVDNGSKEVPPEATVRLPKNIGFAAANNVAWRKFPADDHVLLLNPDTEVRPGVIAAMVRVLEERNDVGIVGPKLINPDRSLQGSVRPFPGFLDFICYMLKLGRVVQARQEKAYDYSKAGYVDQVMGAAFLIRNKTWQEVGMLDEGFFTLFEEVDYCKRALEKGWKTYFTPAGEVMHVQAASFNQLIGFRRTWPWLKSSLRYVRKHLGLGAWLLLAALTPVTLLLTIPASLKHLWLKVHN